MAAVTELGQVPIAGMTCDHCVVRVEDALSRVPGVRDARVNLARLDLDR